MGACACAVNNKGKKYEQNQITVEDSNQIQNQIQAIQEINQYQTKLSLPPTMKRIMSVKQKTQSDINQQIPYQKWSSLASNKQTGFIQNQKTISYNSNNSSLHNSRLVDLEEKQHNSDSSFEQQVQEQNKKIQKQTAKHRNWVFNRTTLIGQGMRQQDNALIQRTINGQSPIKLEAIELIIGVTYHGQWLNAMRHGSGIQVWQDGSRFQGRWEYNQMNGVGKISYSDGDIYEGEWKDDSFHGHGKYICQNGHLYEGQWNQGKKQGKGNQIWEDGETYVGQFKDGLKHGRGVLKFKDGSFYEGQFACNQINGRGKYVWKNSRQYDGDWIKNKMCGFGILKWMDGRYYKGQFSNDKRHGKGEMYYTDGSRYVGNWNQGKQDGHGQIYEGAKLKFVGQWKDGKKIKKNNKYESSSTFSR